MILTSGVDANTKRPIIMTAAILAFVRRARKKRWGVLPPAIALAGC